MVWAMVSSSLSFEIKKASFQMPFMLGIGVLAAQKNATLL